jgi:predicted O-methyltransferase YrrM
VALPAADCDSLRDMLVAHGARIVIEVGLAYGSSALAVGEALCLTGEPDASHIDTAFVDGSHRFHEVFVDLYFLRKLVRPGGLIILDDATWPSVATALRYFDLNLGWQPVSIAGRLTARRLPDEPFEPAFTDFKSFLVADEPAYDRNLIMDDVTQRYLAD